MSINTKKSFQLYHDMGIVVDALNEEQAGQLLKAILAYVRMTDYEIADPMVRIAFLPIQQTLERDHEKYMTIVDRNRQNGSKGGRPKKNPENPVGYLGTQENPSEPKKADKDKDKDKDTGKDKDINHPIVPTGTDTQFWQQVQDLYNEVCPKLKVCRVVNDKRKKLINLRGKECNHDLDVFRPVFKYYNQSPHHIGQNNRNWIADIEFVLREEPFAKGQEEAPLTQQQIVEQQNQEALNMYIGGPPPPQPITDEARKWWEEVTPING